MKKRKSILIIAAHPDDEILGCGASQAKYSAQGDLVYSLIMGEGLSARGKVSKTAYQKLQEASCKAAKILGAQEPIFLGLPDNKLDTLSLLTLIQKIEHIAQKIKPDRVWTHHVGDINMDHQLVHQATVTAFRALPGQNVKELLFFETPSSTDYQVQTTQNIFLPQRFEEVSSYFSLKLQALKCYESEMKAWPHLRSYQVIEHLARYRGAMVGEEYVEAFMVGRQVT